MSPRRVVTLSPLEASADSDPTARSGEALAFVERAAAAGAQVLELRTDLHAPESLPVERLAATLPLLVAERAGKAIPASWSAHASWIDRDIDDPPAASLPINTAPTTTAPTTAPPRAAHDEASYSDSSSHSARRLFSLHAAEPLSPDAAERRWSQVDVGDGWVKHVEPLGDPRSASRLFETRRRLAARFGAARVTVLAMGPLALPFRCVLAEENALDYLAHSPRWSAAPGQRLLADAVRASARGTAPDADAHPRVPTSTGARSPTRDRLAILGHPIVHSRSPRIHPPPFDRLDLPPDTEVGPVLDALLPHYRGFAVTSPFKKAVAAHVGSELTAVNTLFREGDRWGSANTDVEGALAVLERLGARKLTVLGDGGATAAIRLAAERSGRSLRVLKRADLEGLGPLEGACLWTWPADTPVPEGLRFQGGPVAIIAYGPPGRAVARTIEERGGRPRLLGPAWLIAQARRQRTLWEQAT